MNHWKNTHSCYSGNHWKYIHSCYPSTAPLKVNVTCVTLAMNHWKYIHSVMTHIILWQWITENTYTHVTLEMNHRIWESTYSCYYGNESLKVHTLMTHMLLWQWINESTYNYSDNESLKVLTHVTMAMNHWKWMHVCYSGKSAKYKCPME